MNKGFKELLAKIVCVDLRVSNVELEIICEKFNFDYNILRGLKFDRVWVLNGKMVATGKEGNITSDYSRTYKALYDKLGEIEPVEVSVEELLEKSTVEPEVILNSVLESISEKGMESLSDRDKEFLALYSKKI